jgi:hypothetical protein
VGAILPGHTAAMAGNCRRHGLRWYRL